MKNFVVKFKIGRIKSCQYFARKKTRIRANKFYNFIFLNKSKKTFSVFK